MSYATLDNILLDQDTLEAFEALARARCVSPQVLARLVITDAEPRPSTPDLDEFVPRRHATRTLSDKRPERRRRPWWNDLDDEHEPLPTPPDPDEEPASTRLLRRVRSLPPCNGSHAPLPHTHDKPASKPAKGR